MTASGARVRSGSLYRSVALVELDDFVARGGERAAIEPLMSVRADHLQEALDAVAAGSGSVDRYLAVGLGLDARTLEALTKTFLEPA
jgi:hypothetical protein